ncbi:nucleotide exchange factor GrpE [Lentilactobacillus senioris]|uniref:nucleotide exchange factor GrpE n=1 Tax=Lentilactobacillus senioris TaxID=931534 RepID=UPI002283233D|nr:nucleotide exchange factor GrpE [Lentilactobacillus senioris]MCY9806768.1 nucleotide exchange factor GrpE [Lentilactobacillus senioris]
MAELSEEQPKEEQVDNSAVDSQDSKAETDAVDDSQAQIAELTAKVDELENKYLRAEAEIQNIQSHAKKEQADLIKYGAQPLAKAILPIIDNLERALQVEVSDENGEQLKKGVSMVSDHLISAMKENGVELLDVLDKPFDPQFSQAIQTVPADDDHPADTVVSVLQSGYKLKDRVLRPAMVVVAAD